MHAAVFPLNAAIKLYNWLKKEVFFSKSGVPFSNPEVQQNAGHLHLFLANSLLPCHGGISCSRSWPGLPRLPFNSPFHVISACEPLQRSHQHTVVAVQSSYHHMVTRLCLWCLSAKSVRLQGKVLAGMSTVDQGLAKETWINLIKYSLLPIYLRFLKL